MSTGWLPPTLILTNNNYGCLAYNVWDPPPDFLFGDPIISIAISKPCPVTDQKRTSSGQKKANTEFLSNVGAPFT